MELGSMLAFMTLSAASVSAFHMPEKYPIEVYHMLQERTQLGIGRDNRVRGTWGAWSSWSECSRSCGTGIQSQSRECVPPRRLLRRRSITENGTSPFVSARTSARPVCIGTYKRYHTCNTQECPNFSEDLLAQQCAKYNEKSYKNRTYVWIPFLDAPNSCALNCRPVGERFYATLEPAVIDGTPCEPRNLRGRGGRGISTERNGGGERWLCVAGQCKAVGCDGVVGSAVTMDSCGVCGGRGKGCRLFEGIFMRSLLPKGHQQVTTIPKGAMSLNISELRPSSNFLALKDSTDRYILNGPRSYSPSGTYKAAGTTLTYQRGDRNRMECILATGPLNDSLYLEILSVESNPGVLYKYMLPTKEVSDDKAVIAPPLLVAGSKDRGSNEIPNNPSYKHINVRIPVTRSDRRSDLSYERRDRDRDPPRVYDGERKDEIKAMAGDQPKLKATKKKRRKFNWKVVGLAACTKKCGGGLQTAIVKCVRENTQTRVNEKRCRNIEKPLPLRCNDRPCVPRWEAEPWSECSVTCGVGVRTRRLECVQELNAELTVRVAAGACIEPPNLNTTETCGPSACPNANPELRNLSSQYGEPRWDVGTWSPCSVTCGRGTRNRTVTCVTSGEPCSLTSKPESQKACEAAACNTMTRDTEHHASWLRSKWSPECSVECGNGVKVRQVVCANDIELFCDPKERPDAEMPCSGQRTDCDRAKWFTSSWTSCSVTCGTGVQYRDIVCIARTNNKSIALSAENCSDPRPSTQQICKMSACSPEWFTSDWSTCSVTCGVGVQTRLARCIVEGVGNDTCSEIDKPSAKQRCDMEPCENESKSPKKASHECVDKYPFCTLVVKNGLCRIKYYKHSCCQCHVTNKTAASHSSATF